MYIIQFIKKSDFSIFEDLVTNKKLNKLFTAFINNYLQQNLPLFS